MAFCLKCGKALSEPHPPTSLQPYEERAGCGGVPRITVNEANELTVAITTIETAPAGIVATNIRAWLKVENEIYSVIPNAGSTPASLSDISCAS